MNLATELKAREPLRGITWDLSSLGLQSAKLVGPEKIPEIRALPTHIAPSGLQVFTRWNTASTSEGVVLHFFTSDEKQRFAVSNPLKWVSRLSEAAAVISPDLSLFAEYPQCVRRVHTRLNRAAAVVWQDRGLNVIPNVRWNDRSDYEYCFDGVPRHSQVAVSSVTMLRNRTDRRNLVHGFQAMLDELQPTSVIWHGGIPKEMPSATWESVAIEVFPSQTSHAFHERRDGGRR